MTRWKTNQLRSTRRSCVVGGELEVGARSARGHAEGGDFACGDLAASVKLDQTWTCEQQTVLLPRRYIWLVRIPVENEHLTRMNEREVQYMQRQRSGSCRARETEHTAGPTRDKDHCDDLERRVRRVLARRPKRERRASLTAKGGAIEGRRRQVCRPGTNSST